MKKLLSILGAITLVGTASTSVIACGGENPTPPTPDTRINISKQITNPINLGELDANTKLDFLKKLQIALARVTDLSTITNSDYDIYKAGTITAIKDSDITVNTFLNIKIVAKGSKFQGTADNITTNYIQTDTTKALTEIIKINEPFYHTLLVRDSLYFVTKNNWSDGKVYKMNLRDNKYELIISTTEKFNINLIFSLTYDNKNNIIYFGTKTENNKGKLFKIDDHGKLSEINDWEESNGIVRSLISDKNGNVYIGTDTDYINGKGKLFKIDDHGKLSEIKDWKESNGIVRSLISDKNGNVYIGTKINDDEGKLFKIDDHGKLSEIKDWKESNGDVQSLTVDSNNNVYIGTKINDDEGKLFAIK